jgi:hypothetical protein
MTHKPNPSIGTCPCPHRGCSEVGQVKKFAHRSTTDQGRRNAGKLYMDCPTHGRIGFDGKQGTQDYILEHATLEGHAPPAPKKSAPPPAPSAPAPVAKRETAAPPSAPAPRPAPKPAAESSAPKRSGFLLLDT